MSSCPFVLESYNMKIFKNIINNINLAVKIDCDWGSWEIGRCSRSCGGGNRKKTRVKKVKEHNGGKCRDQRKTQYENCNIDRCPGKF